MRIKLATLLVLASSTGAMAQSPAPSAESTNRIAGYTTEVRGGTGGVVVILCDQKTGIPLSADTRRPFIEAEKNENVDKPKLLTAISDERGQFSFENLPRGEYRLVAQKWTGPFKGVFELHGGVIQLFGWADNVRVPSPEALRIGLQPPGEGVMVFDQEVGNNETFLMLSTKPPVADAILGIHAMGTNFVKHIVGVNRMPYGRTTVVGLPKGPVHAFFFAPDNSPGYAIESYELRDNYLRAPRVQFVAMWSDGRHEPTPRLKRLQDLLQQHQLLPETLVGIDVNATRDVQDAAKRKLVRELERKVELPGGETATVGDLMAVGSYIRVQEEMRRRKQASGR